MSRISSYNFCNSLQRKLLGQFGGILQTWTVLVLFWISTSNVSKKPSTGVILSRLHLMAVVSTQVSFCGERNVIVEWFKPDITMIVRVVCYIKKWWRDYCIANPRYLWFLIWFASAYCVMESQVAVAWAVIVYLHIWYNIIISANWKHERFP